MIITHRSRFSATAVLCGASIFVYPAIAWGTCAPVTVNTSATLVSDQLIEQLRQRREQQATVSMFSAGGSSVVNVSTAPTAAGAATTATAAAPAARPRTRAAATKASKERRFLTKSRKARVKAGATERYVEAAPAARPRLGVVAAEPYAASGYPDAGYSLKDAPIGNEAQNGVWAAVYGAYERHTNLNPGEENNPTRTQYTAGVVSGVDTYVSPTGGGYGAPLIQLGVLGGYQSTRSTFTTPPGIVEDHAFNGAQIDEGGFVGVYGSYVLNQFAADLLVKLDLFDHTTEPSATCNAAQTANIPFSGTTSETNTNVASNVYYRFYADGPFWIEPTVGFRYSHTSYGDLASALFLTDGDDLRIQGGVRVGTGGFFNGYFWTASVLGGIYDDVIVNGFTSDALPGSGSAKVDQGKVRGICSLYGRLYDGRGMNYFAQVDVYGGQDVAGVIGKVGARWEW